MSSERNLPASLSPCAIKTQLRRDLGFEGVVVTDDLQMRAVRAGRSLDDAVVLALAAGNDLVIIGNVLEEDERAAEAAVDAIERAAVAGRLSIEALKASFLRIMRLKQRLRR